ncbi:hypothetical protein MT418_002254 [Batrachochytrium dendrobatidis]
MFLVPGHMPATVFSLVMFCVMSTMATPNPPIPSGSKESSPVLSEDAKESPSGFKRIGSILYRKKTPKRILQTHESEDVTPDDQSSSSGYNTRSKAKKSISQKFIDFMIAKNDGRGQKKSSDTRLDSDLSSLKSIHQRIERNRRSSRRNKKKLETMKEIDERMQHNREKQATKQGKRARPKDQAPVAIIPIIPLEGFVKEGWDDE